MSGDVTPRQAAVVAAVSVAVTLLGVGLASALGAPPDLGARPDAHALAAHLADAGPRLRTAVVGWLIAIVGDVVRAWALYAYFKRVNASLAALGAWFMLLHDAVFAATVLTLTVAGEIQSGALGPMAPEVASAAQLVLVRVQYLGFTVGLSLFSGHLLVNGVLALRSTDVPRILGWLMIIAFAGYLVSSTVALAMPAPPPALGAVVAVPNTIGELALMIWLGVRGGRGRPALLQ